ncbi:MAG: putative gufA protein [Nitrososphaeraceae archaeon]|nr:putative gufA protein [Nitrososphaeraceae archaeon]
MLGFAAGVMLAASFFSLLLPALDLSVLQNNTAPWLPVAIGFSLGGISIRIADKIIPHLILRWKDQRQICKEVFF